MFATLFCNGLCIGHIGIGSITFLVFNIRNISLPYNFTNVFHGKAFQENCFLLQKRFCCILGWVSIVILFARNLGGFCYYSLRRWFTLCLGGGERRKEVSKGVSLGHIYYLTGIWESLCCNTLLLSRSLHFSQVRKKVCF